MAATASADMDAVVITAEQRRELANIGRHRNEAKRPEWSRRKSDVFNDREVDVLGLYGEFAVASYLGLAVDSTISSHGDDGADLTWNGLSIAVKFNHRWLGYLMVEERRDDDVANGILKDFTADVIVLTHGKCSPPEKCYCREPGGLVVVLAGWLPRAEFLERMEVRDLGLGNRYICRCEQLRPMHKLWQPWRLLRRAR